VLLYAAIKMLRGQGHAAPKKPLAVGRFLPATDRLHGQRFVVREGGRRLATPLLLALVAIEVTDVIFAVDSVPAVLAVTDDPFIAFSSNALALLGMRALFFVLAGAVQKFQYLKVGLAAVLVFVGVKMTLSGAIKLPPLISLAVVATLLGASILVSVARENSTARDHLVDAGGWILLAAGLALLVLPGPGIPLVLAALGILGRRRPWARSAAHKIRSRAQKVVDRVRPARRSTKTPASLPPVP
jgi:hypothetical protein